MQEAPQEQNQGSFWAATSTVRDAAEGLPIPLDQLLAEVLRCYEARSPEELVGLLQRRYREDAQYVDPTLLSRPRCDLALTFYSWQHLYSHVSVTDITQPAVQLVEHPKGTSLLQVLLHSRQQLQYARTNHISQQILPKSTVLETTTKLLVEPHSGLVVHHEDSWTNKPTLHLPLAWRRLNSVCTNAIYRLIGWGRTLQAAEAACANKARWGDDR